MVNKGRISACTTKGGTSSDEDSCFHLGHEVEEQEGDES